MNAFSLKNLHTHRRRAVYYYERIEGWFTVCSTANARKYISADAVPEVEVLQTLTVTNKGV